MQSTTWTGAVQTSECIAVYVRSALSSLKHSYDCDEASLLSACGMPYSFPPLHFNASSRNLCRQNQTLSRVTELVSWRTSATILIGSSIPVALVWFWRISIDETIPRSSTLKSGRFLDEKQFQLWELHYKHLILCHRQQCDEATYCSAERLWTDSIDMGPFLARQGSQSLGTGFSNSPSCRSRTSSPEIQRDGCGLIVWMLLAWERSALYFSIKKRFEKCHIAAWLLQQKNLFFTWILCRTARYVSYST